MHTSNLRNTYSIKMDTRGLRYYEAKVLDTLKNSMQYPYLV